MHVYTVYKEDKALSDFQSLTFWDSYHLLSIIHYSSDVATWGRYSLSKHVPMVSYNVSTLMLIGLLDIIGYNWLYMVLWSTVSIYCNRDSTDPSFGWFTDHVGHVGSGYPSMTGHSDDSPLQRIPAPNATFQSQEVRAARNRGPRAVSPMSPVPGKPHRRVAQNLGHKTTLIIPGIVTG